MATFLDTSLLGGAKVLLTFLLVYVVAYGLLTWIRPFGKDQPTGPYAIVALAAAFFSVVSGTVRYLIEFMTPWFLFLILFVFFLLLIVRMFNVSEGDLRGLIAMGSVHVWIVIFAIIILLFGLGSAFGQRSLEATQGESGGGVYYQGEGAFDNVEDVEIGGGTSGPGVLQPVRATRDGTPQPGSPGATATGSYSLNLLNTLLHPKVLAIIALLLVAMVSIWLITQSR